MKWEMVKLEELYTVHNGLSKGSKLYPSLVSCQLFPPIPNFLNLASAVLFNVIFSPSPIIVGIIFLSSSFSALSSSIISCLSASFNM